MDKKLAVEIALREYEAAHAKYMSLSVFSDEGKKAKEEMKEKERIYIEATKAQNPNWIVFWSLTNLN